MAEEDVWASKDAEPFTGGTYQGADGFHPNQAFSIDVVFRNGVAMLQEQPVFVLVTALVIGLLQIGPGVVGVIVQLALLGVLGQEQANLVAQIVQGMLALAALPLLPLFTAGICVAVTRYAATDKLDWSLFYTSIMPAVRLFLYNLCVGVIFILMAVVILGPTIGGGIALLVNDIGGPLGGILALVGGLVWFVLYVYVYFGLILGRYAAILDDMWPLEAITTSWRASEGARLTLFITGLVFGILTFVAVLMVYCLIGIALFPIVFGVQQAGMALGWVMHARPEAATKTYPFFQRNPPPYF